MNHLTNTQLLNIKLVFEMRAHDMQLRIDELVKNRIQTVGDIQSMKFFTREFELDSEVVKNVNKELGVNL